METKKKRLSAFSKEFWMQRINHTTGKLYTEEEADFKRRSQRKNDKCYWLLQINPTTGTTYSEEEAIIKATEFHKQISAKGTAASKVTDAYYKNPHKRNTRIEYYLNKGMTVEEAKVALSERQSTFSKDKCIEKYGEDGLKVWEERQNKWQETLNSKSAKEIKAINKKKSWDYKFFLKGTSDEEKQRVISFY